MSSNLENGDVPVKASGSKEYVYNNFDVLNAYIGSLVDSQAAKIKQTAFINKTNRLKIIILSLISLLIISVCLFFWVLSAKGLALTNTNDSNEVTAPVLDLETTRAAALTRLEARKNSAKALELPAATPVVRDFTIFETINGDQNELENISSVTTGYKYSNSEEEFPSSQFCYARGTKVLGNAVVRINVAKLSYGKITQYEMDNDGLRQANISRATFEKLIDYCGFKSQ
ncbi:hypothetical protein N8829_01185 [bacterium]|nr:hypothetical protein [bacterium]